MLFDMFCRRCRQIVRLVFDVASLNSGTVNAIQLTLDKLFELKTYDFITSRCWFNLSYLTKFVGWWMTLPAAPIMLLA